MQIVIISDLHVDSGWPTISWPEGDVLIIAGDTANSVRTTLAFIDDAATRYKHVITTDGNHEHYGNAMAGRTVEDTIKLLCDNLPDNVHFLGHHQPLVTLDGVNFVGCNGWYSFDAGGGDPIFNRTKWKNWMNDNSAIGFETIEQRAVWDRAEDDAALMMRTIEGLTGPTVAVTHTAPHRDMVEWTGNHGWDSNNSFFVNTHMQKVLEAHGDKIDIWINGHSHYPRDKMINGVYCIANPLGYSNERTGRWEPVVVEVGDA